MCYPSDESNNILQMKTTFKKINPKNKLKVSPHSHYDYKSTNYNFNNYQKLQHSKEICKIPPFKEDKYYLLRLWEEGPKSIWR